MNRRAFFRDSLMALSISFLPKILRPELPEVKEEYYDAAKIYECVNKEPPKYGWVMYYDEVYYTDIRYGVLIKDGQIVKFKPTI